MKNGGLYSWWNWILILIGLCCLNTFFKEQGWLPKKKVRGKHVFITGAGSGLG